MSDVTRILAQIESGDTAASELILAPDTFFVPLAA